MQWKSVLALPGLRMGDAVLVNMSSGGVAEVTYEEIGRASCRERV